MLAFMSLVNSTFFDIAQEMESYTNSVNMVCLTVACVAKNQEVESYINVVP